MDNITKNTAREIIDDFAKKIEASKRPGTERKISPINEGQ